MNRTRIKAILMHSALLMSFWIILSGFFDLFHLLLGVFSVVVVLAINHKITQYNYYDEMLPEAQGIRFWRLIYFIPWLLWEVVVSSFKIAYLILHPKMPIKAGLIQFKTSLPHMNAKVLLGNSINLTPGTVTIEIKKNLFLIHSLSNEAVEEHINHSLTLEVAKLYSTEPVKVVYEEKVFTSTEEIT
jgi:multicomponent Na+:H+ antiporter subunit E